MNSLPCRHFMTVAADHSGDFVCVYCGERHDRHGHPVPTLFEVGDAS